MRRALGHLAAVSLAVVVTAGVLSGAGSLFIFGLAPTPSPPPARGAAVVGRVPEPTAVIARPSATTTAPPRQTNDPSPTPTRAPYVLAPFLFSGHSYLGITTAETQPVFAAPFAGTVEVRVYQLIDGQVRVGSNVPGLPFFPYVAIVASDRRLVLRPGALDTVTEVSVRDGAAVTRGDALFRLVGPGPSSWATFYDTRATYQVVASLQSIPGGRDLDPAPYFSAP